MIVIWSMVVVINLLHFLCTDQESMKDSALFAVKLIYGTCTNYLWYLALIPVITTLVYYNFVSLNVPDLQQKIRLRRNLKTYFNWIIIPVYAACLESFLANFEIQLILFPNYIVEHGLGHSLKNVVGFLIEFILHLIAYPGKLILFGWQGMHGYLLETPLSIIPDGYKSIFAGSIFWLLWKKKILGIKQIGDAYIVVWSMIFKLITKKNLALGVELHSKTSKAIEGLFDPFKLSEDDKKFLNLNQ